MGSAPEVRPEWRGGSAVLLASGEKLDNVAGFSVSPILSERVSASSQHSHSSLIGDSPAPSWPLAPLKHADEVKHFSCTNASGATAPARPAPMTATLLTDGKGILFTTTSSQRRGNRDVLIDNAHISDFSPADPSASCTGLSVHHNSPDPRKPGRGGQQNPGQRRVCDITPSPQSNAFRLSNHYRSTHSFRFLSRRKRGKISAASGSIREP